MNDKYVWLELTDEERDIVKVFLKHEGNITSTCNELSLHRVELKTKLRDINIKIGNELDYPGLISRREHYQENDREDKISPSTFIIDKLNESFGKAKCPMLRGKPIDIWMTDKGVCVSSFPGLVCEWRIFDAIVEKLKELKGKMYRGDTAAQNGDTIGSKRLSLDTIDGFISVNFYGKKVGEKTTRRSTYYAAILAWSGFVTNCPTDSGDEMGGYILLNKGF